ncbi:glutamine--fructose-6-phosphate transaminase (isomerizing) [Roseofilum reptotaenium CS-1145]|uniref:Glutamine--fructose-6-phosphate aminotransferase [isomerizing] n=1 Tax=Roseofilum reptotaenium AO1-A TaxID=1925591 RepID=A0A1L9QS13_9CYAN|nr:MULTISPECIES: glutamine--fructose-6-phosphate transaminase (isomerizing) [Roseofilum]MBP0027627.1 glutamine--fructose-6-phosphate transaminase (isomerizing) [Roseofilum sp. Guam]MDB9515879.1 glutamine--fructose-6-phosphate transaminase (isomerizing) [Roseofilum reptotaenium CS-1145]OJJ25416.1 glutamine--fructose-6-phosphate aminotransferase [Roseofilum reptotaenium AO1-A]
MCGIVGYIGTQEAQDILLSGLEKLEYRGYDSAGVAMISEGELHAIKAKGKLYNLRDKLRGVEDKARLGIGHTRWATHGKPEEYNAHPHTNKQETVAVVQNGIVENYRELREELKAKGHEFVSDTDTEVIPHLISDYLSSNPSSFLEAVRQTVNRLEGAFALAVISTQFPDELIVVRQQAPLVIGFGQGEFFCASDTPALVSHTHIILPLDNGEMARLTPLGVEVYDFRGERRVKYPQTLNWNPSSAEKQGFRHFMLKEIYEQPTVLRTQLDAYFDPEWYLQPQDKTRSSQSSLSVSSQGLVQLNLPKSLYENLEQIYIVACGTSWHAALVGKHLLEQWAGIPTCVQYASEFRYSPPPLTANTLTIGVTQSGETADTLAALGMEQERRKAHPLSAYQPRMLGITNRPESSLGRLIPYIINTHANLEVGVAATKTFSAQVMAFYALALDLADRRQSLKPEVIESIIKKLRELPALIERLIEEQDRYIGELAHQFNETSDFIFLGRGINFPIALEGALKLKEISYIHAEGYPAGEMKHGPIALLDAKVPVVAIATPGDLYEKVLSNAQEAKARDARLIGVTPKNSLEAQDIFNQILAIPTVDEFLSPLVTVIPLQLLAYHIAALRGLDVDQPRNLAKSVTVE